MFELRLNAIVVGSFCNAFFSFILGLFVFFKNPRSKVNKYFFIMNVFITGWAFFVAFLAGNADRDSALFFARINNLFALFIPVFFLHFVLALIDRISENIKFLVSFYTLNIVVLVFSLVFPGHFVGDVKPKMDLPMYTDEPGFLYFIFTFLFLIETGYAIKEMVKVYPLSSAIKKTQIKYTIVASIVGFVFGGSTFPLVYDISVYPWPNIFMWLWTVILAYAIVKHRLFEIETVIHRTLMWLLASATVFVPIALFVFLSRPLFVRMGSLMMSIYLTVMFFIFKFYHNKVQPQIDHFFRRKKYDYSQILGMLSVSLKGVLDINELAKKVSISLKGALYLQKIGIVVRDVKKDDFYVLIEEGFRRELSYISVRDEVIGYLHERGYLEPELVEVDPSLEYIKGSVFYRFLQEEDIPLVMSISFGEDFIGFIVLGRKENLQSYTMKDIQILESIAGDISIYFYNALHHKDIVEKQRLEEELRLGRQLQESLLPRKRPEVEGCRVYGMMKAAKEIGGDYYDFIEWKGREGISLAIGDVSGKGLDAGIVMAMIKTIVYSFALERGIGPREVLRRVNEVLYYHISLRKPATLLYFEIKGREGVVRYSSAGHECILVRRREEVEVIKSGGILLGIIRDVDRHLEEKEIELRRGDKILLYTDGATEARNPRGEMYGLERLVESFRRYKELPIEELIKEVYQDIQRFISTQEQYDDITLVGIEKE